MDTNISFGSVIRPVKSSEFNKITSNINRKNFVDYPWTIKESAVANDVYTKRICDCTSVLITDGQKAALMHLNPAKKENHFIVPIIEFIRSNFKLPDKNLQAIVVGSKNTCPSQDIYNKCINILNELKIPFSILKNGKSPTHIAYRTNTDEILVSNLSIDKALSNGETSLKAFTTSFDKVFISENDNVL